MPLSDEELEALAAQLGAVDAPPEPPAAPARFDPTRMAMGPGAIPQGVDVSEAAPTVAAISAAPFASALGAGAALGGAGSAALRGGAAALRFAATPKGGAVIEGAREAMSGGNPAEIALAAGRGALEGAGLGKLTKHIPLPKFLKAKLAHTLARGAKVAAEAAPEAAKASAPAAKEAVKAATPTVEDVSARALKLIESKLSPGQVAEVLRSEFAPGARGIGVGYFRRLTDQLIAHAAKGAK